MPIFSLKYTTSLAAALAIAMKLLHKLHLTQRDKWREEFRDYLKNKQEKYQRDNRSF